MFEEFLFSINTFLLHHPHLLRVMHALFWVKYWILMALMGVFVFLVYSEDHRRAEEKRRAAEAKTPGRFLA